MMTKTKNDIRIVRILLSVLLLCTSIASGQVGGFVKRSGRSAGTSISSKEGDSCKTPSGDSGTCINIGRCQEILSFARGNPGNENAMRDHVNKLLCQPPVTKVVVCCTNVKAQPSFNPLSNSFLLEINDKNNCGELDSTRIIGGAEFEHGHQPWLAAIGVIERNAEFTIQCGGVIITKKHILSAAHCFDKQSQRQYVRLGEHNVKEKNTDFQIQQMEIASIKKHPEYMKPRSKDNDLVVITLKQQILRYDYHIKRICLPYGLPESNYEGEYLNTAGWGRTDPEKASLSDVPRQVEIEIKPLSQCRSAYRRAKTSVSIDDKKICGGGRAGDTCQGDSGGPLINYDKKRFRHFLAGIVSSGSKCGDDRHPGIYTKIYPYLQWIKENIL